MPQGEIEGYQIIDEIKNKSQKLMYKIFLTWDLHCFEPHILHQRQSVREIDKVETSTIQTFSSPASSERKTEKGCVKSHKDIKNIKSRSLKQVVSCPTKLSSSWRWRPLMEGGQIVSAITVARFQLYPHFIFFKNYFLYIC